MTSTIRYQGDNIIYQPKLPLDQTFSYEESVPKDDISRTVREAVEGANIIKYVNFAKDGEGRYVCLAGHAFEPVSERMDERGIYPKLNETCATGKCEGCALRSECTKSASGRKITVCRKQDEYEEMADALVRSEEGAKLMAQRSIQCEGVFGNIKEDNGYGRLRRRGKAGVTEEIYLVAMGHNLRRYHAAKTAKMKMEAAKAARLKS